jgi:predicted nucleic acid-binding protein
MRVFLDANILFSAAKTDGPVRQLLRELSSRHHELCIDEYVLVEARRNLERKAEASLRTLDQIVEAMRVSPYQAVPRLRPDLEWLAEKDRPVLMAAIRAKCDSLLTGDRAHFGPAYGKSFGGVTIHSPRLLAELLFSGKTK